MARIETIIDDLSGANLSESVEPTIVEVDGTKYTVDLGSASKDHFIKWLSGEGAYNYKAQAQQQSNSAPAASTGATRVRLTGEAKAKFDKAMEEYNEAKAEQRVKIYEFAATTEAHKDAKDSGKNIGAALLNDFYDKHPKAVRYYGSDKVEPPKNTDYV